MKVLITGAGGFVGNHLLNYFAADPTTELHGTVLETAHIPNAHARRCQWWVVNLIYDSVVRDLLQKIRPDRIYHLAGQAFVPRSFEAPWETLENNIRGTLSLLQAVKELRLDIRLLNVGSADVYGPAARLPITEQTPFTPTSPYSVSKIAQDMLAWQYFLAHQIHVIRMRPFNHIGPGQNNRFAASDWAQQIADAEAGRREPVVRVGNLSAARDFTDVRDVVRAYVLALEHATPGDALNVCSGMPRTMQSILDTLISLSTIPIRVEVATERYRPVDIPVLYGDHSLLTRQTGWTPEIPLDRTLQDLLEEWRVLA